MIGAISMRNGAVAFLAVFSGVVILVTSAASTTACSSDDPVAPANTVDAGDGGATLSAEAEAFLQGVCSTYATCCNSATTKESCIDKTRAAALGKTFDATRARTCLDSITKESKDKRNEIFCAQAPDIATCGSVFKAKTVKPAGNDCVTHDECISGDAVDFDGLCLAKKCRQIKRGTPGTACVGTRYLGHTSIQFPNDLASAPSAVCVVNDGLYCEEISKTCKTRGAIGEDCSPIDGACIDTAYCATDSKKCTPRLDNGKECAATEECGVNAYCANDEDTGKTICKALSPIGGACERGDECSSREGLQCNTDTTKCALDTALYDAACLGANALN